MNAPSLPVTPNALPASTPDAVAMATNEPQRIESLPEAPNSPTVVTPPGSSPKSGERKFSLRDTARGDVDVARIVAEERARTKAKADAAAASQPAPPSGKQVATLEEEAPVDSSFFGTLPFDASRNLDIEDWPTTAIEGTPGGDMQSEMPAHPDASDAPGHAIDSEPTVNDFLFDARSTAPVATNGAHEAPTGVMARYDLPHSPQTPAPFDRPQTASASTTAPGAELGPVPLLEAVRVWLVPSPHSAPRLIRGDLPRPEGAVALLLVATGPGADLRNLLRNAT